MKGVFLLSIILTAHLVLAEESDEMGADDRCTKILKSVRKQLEENRKPFEKMLEYACANVGESKVSSLGQSFKVFFIPVCLKINHQLNF